MAEDMEDTMIIGEATAEELAEVAVEEESMEKEEGEGEYSTGVQFRNQSWHGM